MKTDTHFSQELWLSVQKQHTCAFNADSGPVSFGNKNTYCTFQENKHLHHYLAANPFAQTSATDLLCLSRNTYKVNELHLFTSQNCICSESHKRSNMDELTSFDTTRKIKNQLKK